MSALLPGGTPSSSARGGGSVGKDRPHGSISISVPGGARKANTDLEFNLGTSKARVMKLLDDRTPAPFKKFFSGPLYDSLLNACLLYFTSRFMHECEMEQQRLELSPIYSQIILKYSTYDKPQQDKMFFESLYETLRKYAAPRSVDTLGVKELYALKHETSNRALNAKMLTSLYAKPPSLAVQVASVTNSPLISQYISSPIVARAKVKDPLERRQMFDSLAQGQAASPRTKISRAFNQLGDAGEMVPEVPALFREIAKSLSAEGLKPAAAACNRLLDSIKKEGGNDSAHKKLVSALDAVPVDTMARVVAGLQPAAQRVLLGLSDNMEDAFLRARLVPELALKMLEAANVGPEQLLGAMYGPVLDYSSDDEDAEAAEGLASMILTRADGGASGGKAAVKGKAAAKGKGGAKDKSESQGPQEEEGGGEDEPWFCGAARLGHLGVLRKAVAAAATKPSQEQLAAALRAAVLCGRRDAYRLLLDECGAPADAVDIARDLMAPLGMRGGIDDDSAAKAAAGGGAEDGDEEDQGPGEDGEMPEDAALSPQFATYKALVAAGGARLAASRGDVGRVVELMAGIELNGHVS
eukprot:XP_001691774.1 predicted protein [Chlamydomonas reinhardtii]